MKNKTEYDPYLHQELVNKKGTYDRKGLSGLINLGNTCFMNSTLQCLSHSVKLTDFLITRQHKLHDNMNKITRKSDLSFLNSYILLLDEMWLSNKLIQPKVFFNNLCKLVPKYKELKQQDSHECMTYILDLLHKSICYEVEVDIQGEIKTETDRLMKLSLETWKKHYQTNYSFIKEIFDGMYYTSVKCNKCDFKEDVFEPFNTMSLDIPNANQNSMLTLQSCFKHTFSKENIDSWTCDKCKEKGCTKNTTLWNLPDYLIVHLKRFDKTGRKIQNFISYSTDDINIKDIVSTDKQDPNNYIYSLYAVNYHSGGLNGGHYWSSCKNLDENWYLLNDGHVNKINNTSEVITKDAYMLFYYRKYIPKPKQEE